LILHPFLFALYPVLALLAHNIEEVPASAAFRSLLISLAAAVLLLLISWLLLKNIRKSALVTTLTLILFFSYGRLYAAVDQFNSLGITLGRHRILIPLFLILFALLALWILRQKGDLRTVTRAANLVGVILIIFPLLSIGRFLVNSNSSTQPTLSPAFASPAQASSTPDIYYIILDGYSREDVLKRLFDYDNTPFIQSLHDLGFHVANCSQSNYAQTQLSLASSLNMDYLQTLDEIYADPIVRSRAALPRFIRNSTVRQFLERQGYTTVAFETGWGWTDIQTADYYLSPDTHAKNYLGMMSGANDFEVMLIKTSGALLIADATIKLPELLTPDLDSPRKVQRQRILYILDTLPKIPRLPGPKFVFAHIVSPHSPYLFGADGGPVERDIGGKQGYRDQVIHINKRILPILKQIIEESPTQPIIILQADHGWSEGEAEGRMPILNAFYFPNGGEQVLYDSITPVNTFRLLFDYYFNAHYNKLEDISYYSKYDSPYAYTVLTDQSPGCEK
jgi:hypothetical protein